MAKHLTQKVSHLHPLGIAGLLGALFAIASAPGAGGGEMRRLWTLDPLGLGLVILGGWTYWLGTRRLRGEGVRLPAWRQAMFGAGLLVIFLALISPVHALSEQFFLVHQGQHLALRVLAPVLLLLGAPVLPLIMGLRAWSLGSAVSSLLSRRTVRRSLWTLTHPVPAIAMFLGVLLLWQLPGPHDLAVRSGGMHFLMHLTMFGSGLFFWWLVVDPFPFPSRIGYGMRLLYLGIAVIPNALLGLVITLSRVPLYGAYGERAPSFTMDAVHDQRWGGLITWLPMEISLLVAGAIIFAIWYRQETAGPRRG